MTSDDMEWQREERAYFDEALNALKKEASESGLMVDSSATSELKSSLDAALADATRTDGAEAFSARHHMQFDQTIVSIAEEATKVARMDDGPYVMAEHVELAIQNLTAEASLGWPWSGEEE